MKRQNFKMTMPVTLKKQVAFLLLFLSFCFHSFAQKKPALPVNFFQKFSYTLPSGFNYNDSIQLNSEVVRIASDLLKNTNRGSTKLYHRR
jgi:hypothetical protein